MPWTSSNLESCCASEWVKLLSIYCAKLRLKEFTPINRDAAVQMLGTLIETFSRRKAENVALLASFADLFNPAKRYAAERDGQDERYTAYPARWLCEERWNDQPQAVAVIDQDGNPIPQLRQQREPTLAELAMQLMPKWRGEDD